MSDTEPDGIPVGVDQLLTYRYNQARREMGVALRDLQASIDAQATLAARVLAEQDAVRFMADTMSAQLGRRNSMRP